MTSQDHGGGAANQALILQARLESSYGEPEDVFTMWREGIAPYFDSQPLYDAEKEPPKYLELSQFHLGQFLFYDAHYSRQKFVRDKRWMAQHDDIDQILLQVWPEGESQAAHGGAEFIQQPGNVFAVNSSYELDASATDARTINLALTRDWVRQHVPQLLDRCGPLFQKNWSMASNILYNYLLSMSDSLQVTQQSDLPLINDNITVMLESLVAYGDVTSEEVSSNTITVITSYIDKNLQNPELGTDALCKHFRCSRSTLYRLFRPLGGVQSYIQDRRLRGCYKALTSPLHMDKQVFEVALMFGFTNPSHFSNLFKRHYDMTPKQARDVSALDHLRYTDDMEFLHDGTPRSIAEQMRLWAKTLNEKAQA